MYKELEGIRCRCYKVLPLVYDDSMSYYEVLCKIVDKVNEIVDKVNELERSTSNE